MNPNEVGVTGSKGRIGSLAVKRGFIPLDFDVCDATAVFRGIQQSGVKVVWHLAAQTSVDWCEMKEHEDAVIAVNLHGVFNVVRACQELNIPVVFMSSDHVFGGKNKTPYVEDYVDEDDAPVNFYGMTKIAGEGLVLGSEVGHVVRTSFIFDDPSHLLYAKDMKFGSVKVPTMIRRSFMYTEDFVDSMVDYFSLKTLPKVLHVSGAEIVSWYTFMQEYCKVCGIKSSSIQPRSVYYEEGYAPRPKYGGLDVSKAKELGIRMSDYKKGLERWRNSQ